MTWGKAIRPISERFWEKVNKDGPTIAYVGTPCWVWIGTRCEKGYGRVCISRQRRLKAHRVSWEIHYGLIPVGYNVLHKCDNTSCIRPDHLFLGTQLDNVIDRHKKKRDAKPSGIKHGRAKLTEQDVLLIRKLYIPRKVTHEQLASRFGVSSNHIHSILSRKTWKHLTNEDYEMPAL